MSVSTGNTVQIHYTGRLQTGEEFDSSLSGEPLEFVAGGDEVIQGVSQAVVGMSVGDKKSLSIAPEEGYGPRHDQLVQTVPRSAVPDEVQEGDELVAPDDQRLVFRILELNDSEAVIDANHPLAGETLLFEIELVSVAD